jgi:hypothetical protein
LNVIDVWAQHPTAQFLSHDMFEHIRRWMGIQTVPDTIPPELTLGAMDAGKVQLALLSAWWGPQGPLLSNDEVASPAAPSLTSSAWSWTSRSWWWWAGTSGRPGPRR